MFKRKFCLARKSIEIRALNGFQSRDNLIEDGRCLSMECLNAEKITNCDDMAKQLKRSVSYQAIEILEILSP